MLGRARRSEPVEASLAISLSGVRHRRECRFARVIPNPSRFSASFIDRSAGFNRSVRGDPDKIPGYAVTLDLSDLPTIPFNGIR